jgi:hypothetical protein
VEIKSRRVMMRTAWRLRSPVDLLLLWGQETAWTLQTRVAWRPEWPQKAESSEKPSRETSGCDNSNGHQHLVKAFGDESITTILSISRGAAARI